MPNRHVTLTATLRLCLCACLVGGAAVLAAVPELKLTHAVTNPSPIPGDQFGYSVAYVGENLLVGTPFADLGGTDAGAAYLIDGQTGEVLHMFQKPEPATGDWFGISVAAVGDSVLVGALGDDTGEHDAGAAYLFDGETGELLRTFQKPTPGVDDWFGGAVAALGNNVLVGVPLDDLGAANAGAAYLFDGETGALLQTFRNPTPAADDWFGVSLAGSGEQVVVGAFLDDTGRNDAGAAYVFNAGTGALLHTLQKPTPAAGDQLGVSVAFAVSGILVGAPYDDTGQRDAGAAYLFDSATGALLRALQAPTPTAGELFGRAVAAAGDLLLVGAPRETTGAAGAAYLLEAATATPALRLQNPTPAPGDQFGFAVALTPLSALIAAPADPADPQEGGAAFLFGP